MPGDPVASCWICGERGRVRVVDSRPARLGTAEVVRRRRHCRECGRRWSTLEIPEELVDSGQVLQSRRMLAEELAAHAKRWAEAVGSVAD